MNIGWLWKLMMNAYRQGAAGEPMDAGGQLERLQGTYLPGNDWAKDMPRMVESGRATEGDVERVQEWEPMPDMAMSDGTRGTTPVEMPDMSGYLQRAPGRPAQMPVLRSQGDVDPGIEMAVGPDGAIYRRRRVPRVEDYFNTDTEVSKRPWDNY